MNAQYVIGQVYSSKRFSYLKERRTFSVECTEVPEAFCQLWVDAADIGFGIRSENTGQVEYFTLDSSVKNADDEVMYWVFKIFNPSRDRDLARLRVHIFND